MDRYIVFSKQLSKADALVLKNLAADIKDISAKPKLEGDGLSDDGNKRRTHPKRLLTY